MDLPDEPDDGIKTMTCVHCGTHFRRDDARLQIYCSTPCKRKHTMVRLGKVKQMQCQYDDHIGVSLSRDMHDFAVLYANELHLSISEYVRQLIQKDYDDWLLKKTVEKMKGEGEK